MLWEVFNDYDHVFSNFFTLERSLFASLQHFPPNPSTFSISRPPLPLHSHISSVKMFDITFFPRWGWVGRVWISTILDWLKKHDMECCFIISLPPRLFSQLAAFSNPTDSYIQSAKREENSMFEQAAKEKSVNSKEKEKSGIWSEAHLRERNLMIYYTRWIWWNEWKGRMGKLWNEKEILIKNSKCYFPFLRWKSSRIESRASLLLLLS